MDSYVKSVTVDVNAEENYTMVKAKQGDKINRKIAITLKKDGANFTPSGASQIWFRMEKPDGNIAIVKSTDSGSPISVSGNIYTVSLTEQCLTASGEAWCDLAFLDASGNTLSSAAFVMKIIPMPNGDSATSISEWTDLQKAIDDAERFANIVAFRTSGNYIQYTVDGQTWTNLVNVGAIGGDLQTQINHKMDIYTMPTTSSTGVPTDEEIISSLALGNSSEVFAVNFTLSNGRSAFCIIWEKLWTDGASGIGFGYYDNYKNIWKYQYVNSTLRKYLSVTEIETNITNINRILTNTATVEITDTATKNYSIGEFVVVNGILYRTISAISNGDIFTINTNIVPDKIASHLPIVQDVSLTLSGMASNITNRGTYCKKYGNIVFLSIDVAITGSLASSMGVVLPQGSRPFLQISSPLGNGLGTGVVNIVIRTNGEITIYPQGSGYCQGVVTFLTN